MSLPIDLVLVRHGESEGNLAKRRDEQGVSDVYTPAFLARHTQSFRLSDKGREQTLAARDVLAGPLFTGMHFDRYMVSEYIRAIETAGGLALPHARWSLNSYLSERDWGELDRYTPEVRRTRFREHLEMKDIQPFYWRPLNGESFNDLCLRIDRVLETLHRESSHQRVIIVCHGEVMWAFRIRLERMFQEEFRELHLSKNQDDRIWNCQIHHYSRRNPNNGLIEDHANWMRIIRPIGSPVLHSDWTRIIRRTYTNEDLRDMVNRVERMIT